MKGFDASTRPVRRSRSRVRGGFLRRRSCLPLRFGGPAVPSGVHSSGKPGVARGATPLRRRSPRSASLVATARFDALLLHASSGSSNTRSARAVARSTRMPASCYPTTAPRRPSGRRPPMSASRAGRRTRGGSGSSAGAVAKVLRPTRNEVISKCGCSPDSDRNRAKRLASSRSTAPAAPSTAGRGRSDLVHLVSHSGRA